MRNTRRYGGYVVHFGIVLIFLGISGTAFNQDKQMEMPPGAQMTIGPYRLTNQTFDSARRTATTNPSAPPSPSTATARQIIMLYPEKRFYPANQESGTMVAIYSTLKEDLYVVYAGTQSGHATAGDSRLSESAGEMDLAGWRDRGAGHAAGACCPIAAGAGAARRGRTGFRRVSRRRRGSIRLRRDEGQVWRP